MNEPVASWQARVDEIWARASDLAPEELVRRVDALAQERPERDAGAMFERGCARDTAGLEEEAEQFYRAALATGDLDEYRRARAIIQLGSTLRWLGKLDDSERVLREELDRHLEPGHVATLHDEAKAFLALTWLAQGRAGEAAGLLLSALAPRLSRYRRSVAQHAQEWTGQTWAS